MLGFTAIRTAIGASALLKKLLLLFGSLLSVALLVWSLYASIHEKGFNAGKAECMMEQQAEIDKLRNEIEAAKEAARKEKHEALKKLSARNDALLRQLRDRPIRPPEPIEGSASEPRGAGGTGAGLYREDGEFLAGEATAAVRLQEALKECRKGYVN
jgi:hypothetical protein